MKRAVIGDRVVRVLFVEDQAQVRRMVGRLLNDQAHIELVAVQSSTAAVHALQAGGFDLVVSDYELGEHELGTEVLAIAATMQPSAERWLTSARHLAGGRLDGAPASRFVWKLELVNALRTWVGAA